MQNVCEYNAYHIVHKDKYEEHLEICPDKAEWDRRRQALNNTVVIDDSSADDTAFPMSDEEEDWGDQVYCGYYIFLH